MTECSASELETGQTAHVLYIERSHPLRRRLLELGAVRGAPLTLLRTAPLGDPVHLRLGGTELALRRADLRPIRVQR